MQLNKRRISISPILFLFLLGGIFIHVQAQDVYPGYAFYSSGKSCKLYDMDKDLVHTWTSNYNCAGASRLLRDSSVMFVGRNPEDWSGGVLQSGRFQIITWDGDVVWDFQYSSSTYCPHHNIDVIYYTDDPKETPNLLLACYEKVSGTSSLVDKVTEIKRTGQTTGDIVWEWHAWDHRTSSPNDHPELLKESSTGGMGEWTHLNSVHYNRDLDQVVCGLKSFREFVIIDHSTSTQEAAGSTGGKYGMGGDILYRWGKASNYGFSGSDYLSGFHSARWVLNKMLGTNDEVPGGGNIVIFHNDQSELLEVEPPGDGDGIYPREPNEAFGPDEPIWSQDMSSLGRNEGSIQKLPNGNYFVSDNRSAIFEMTPAGDKVWTMSVTAMQAFKYPLTYFDQVTPVNENTISAQKNTTPKVYLNPVCGTITISFKYLRNSAEISIFTISGKKLFSGTVNQNHFAWNAKNNPNGVYLVRIKNGDTIYSRYLNVIK